MNGRNSAMNVFIGVLSTFVGHAIALFTLYLLASVIMNFFSSLSNLLILFLYAVFGIGLTQFLYVVPLCFWLRKRERFDTMKGVMIGAVLTLLLNGSCFLLLTTAFRY